MLRKSNYVIPQRGFSIVELAVVIAIIGIVMGVALPMYQTWIRNTQIRTAAESIQNGLQLARATAAQRNTQVEFIFTSTAPISANVTAAASVAGDNWLIRIVDTTATNRFVQGRAVTEGSRNVQITKPQASYIFTSLGRLTTTPVSPIVVTDSALSASDVRTLNVQVDVGGNIRMCDPKLTLTKPSDPQAC